MDIRLTKPDYIKLIKDAAEEFGVTGNSASKASLLGMIKRWKQDIAIIDEKK